MKTSLIFSCCFFLAIASFAQQDIAIAVDDRPVKIAEPLYIVDDLEWKSDNTAARNRISQLDPASIERIEIVKGQSALDTYGDKGKNGVVIVTTKEFAKKSKIRKG